MTNNQIKKMLSLMFADRPWIGDAVEAVILDGETVYRAELDFGLAHKTLASKVKRAQKQIEYIDEILNS